MPNDSAYLPLRSVLVVGLGNALEFYDFLTFSFFAVQIGHCFFPVSQTKHGLLFSLATFGVGFVTRPLGAVILGRYGDRAGRRPAMLWSFGLMGLAILGVTLTPSYASIGVAAPVILVLFRLVQGFAVGGEVGPSTAFLVEAAPPDRRGFYMSVWLANQYLSGLAAGVVGFVLASVLSSSQLDAWGWRIAFLMGGAIVPLGLYMRRRLPETLRRRQDEDTSGETGGRVPVRLLLLAILMLAGGTTSSYLVDYMNTYAQDALRLGAQFGFGATIIESLCGVCAAPVGGLLSDRLGRKPVMLSGLIGLLLLVFPAYTAMMSLRSPMVVYGTTAVLGVLAPVMINGVLTTVSESLPDGARSGVFGILYAAAVMIFGAFAQFNVKALTELTGSSMAPAWYWGAVLVMAGCAMLSVRESAPRKARFAVATVA